MLTDIYSKQLHKRQLLHHVGDKKSFTCNMSPIHTTGTLAFFVCLFKCRIHIYKHQLMSIIFVCCDCAAIIHLCSIQLPPFLVPCQETELPKKKNYLFYNCYFLPLFLSFIRNTTCVSWMCPMWGTWDWSGNTWMNSSLLKFFCKTSQSMKMLNICQRVVLILLYTDWQEPCSVMGPNQQLHLECLFESVEVWGDTTARREHCGYTAHNLLHLWLT